MGLEPMTSRVWGERSSRLSYASKIPDQKYSFDFQIEKNGDSETRTRDLYVANVSLSQLSYIPMNKIIAYFIKNASIKFILYGFTEV